MLNRARKYVSKCPPASEPGRNDALNKLAYAVLERFDLSEADFDRLLLDWAAACAPPMSEREALSTIRSAWNAAHRNGRIGVKAMEPSKHTTPHARTAHKPATPRKTYDLSAAQELPEPLDDGCRRLLRAVFRTGEGIRIVNARLNEDGAELPDGPGPCLSREEWLRKLDVAKGNPNTIFSSTKGTGIYISINPLQIGGSKDADVTDFRHALVEFDESLSVEEQFKLYTVSELPCSAIIYSGGKSVHAWVKVDAVDRQEYDQRVKLLYSHFEQSGFNLDVKNKNPSRLSRLPSCQRFTRRQELLALDTGKPSFTEWIKHTSDDDLGKCDRFSDLINLDTQNDPNCVVGFRDGKTLRYLCRGKSGWIIGPSGIGKSSLICEFAIAWAMGLPAFGIETGGNPLKSMIVQAENDRMDLAEMVQGIARAHTLNAFTSEEMFEQVDRNILFKSESCSVGEEFMDRLHRLIDRDRPDIVWIDPLLSFAGIDVSNQSEVTHFLRKVVNPVLESTGVVMIGVHHTGKPKNIRETQSWNAIDWAYSGLGSSELVNWARAVMILRPVSDTQFELKLAKRGKRAWARHLNGEFTTSLWLQHSTRDIRWEQIDPPAEPDPAQKEAKRSPSEKLAGSNLHEILNKIPTEGESAKSLGERLCLHSKKHPPSIGLTTCRIKVLDLLVENGKLEFSEPTGLYIRGKNA